MIDSWKKYFVPKRKPAPPPVCEDGDGMQKRLIEGFCSYQSGRQGRAALRKLPAYLPPGDVFVVANQYRMAQDFGRAIGRKVHWLSECRDLQGMNPLSVVVLGDKPFGEAGFMRYDMLMDEIKASQSRYGFDIWKIREWRFSDD